MTSIIKLEALSGVQDDGPLCYLLQVDEVFFLLDCGWDERFDMAYIEAVKRRVPQINAVLLSYADILHLGALPYLVRKCGMSCPIYATVPVYKMGQMFLYDWVNGHTSVEDFTLFNLDDIDGAFERVQQVKYSQTILLKGDNGLQITPLPAGHMIGGAIWRITKMGDEEIVYAVDFNHKKERHLNGCTFEGIGRPNLMITDSFNALYNQPRRKQRDEQLVTKLLGTVRDGGDVMIVIDTAGRVLEIAHLLDQLWHNAEAGLMTYNLVMLSHVASSVVEFAKSQVEWMSDKILKSFEMGRYNPFQFRHVQLCHTHIDLLRVVLVSGVDMECGFSREIFLEWCADVRNTVIVTGRSGDRTLGAKLIRIAEQMVENPNTVNRNLTLEVKRRIRLDGIELENYRAKKRAEEREAARKRLEASRRNARLEQAESSDDSDDDTVMVVATNAVGTAIGSLKSLTAGHPSKHASATSLHGAVPSSPSLNGTVLTPAQLAEQRSHDIMWRWEQQQKSSFFKQNKKAFPVFPYIEEKTRWDDYGEIIRPEEYMIADTSIVPHTTTERVSETVPGTPGSENGQTVPHFEEREWPTKCISQITKMEVLCKVEFIDFEGRSDGESIKKILSQIKPKQLIIVHGSAAATRHLAQYAAESGCVQGKIFTPRLGEIVDATIESHIYQVTLSDALMSSLIFQTVKDAELSWLDARISKRKAITGATSAVDETGAEREGTSNEGEPMEQDQDREQQQETDDGERLSNKKAASADTFCLEPMPSSNIPSHQAVFVNDPKLSDMKQLLMANGFHAEFSSGVLYINNVASIRRNEAGRFHVEGCACEDYYKIRDIVYAQFAIV
ncbi:putative cleavage and polyadenylation specificity factor subunit 2 [Toxocara canis]|uniref:Cleavage and polyadenylation specificity factor subunit 2 n=1 Tax=Toxocara canis TaxID=6265 RepID=A0A0B2VLX6_TOXCA|nr:putative cleavage and polyadenylation specificity factor subunit 2 [Toxocara canis]